VKRKDDATGRQRMDDQIIGFLAFPLVNVPLFIISQKLESWALPWLVNIMVLVLAYLFRPEFGAGYMAFMAIAIAVLIALSVVFVAACFVSIWSAEVIGELAIALFVLLMGVGLYGVGVFALHVFRSWQSSYKNNSQ
jgi:hypothetical protein